MMMASNFVVIASRQNDGEARATTANPPSTAIASSVSATGRSCPPLRGDQPAAGLVAAQGAEHRADDARADAR